LGNALDIGAHVGFWLKDMCKEFKQVYAFEPINAVRDCIHHNVKSDNYKLLPLIKEMNIPITIFLCSHIVGTNRHYWFKHQVDVVSTEKLKKMGNKERLDLLKKSGFEQQKDFGERMALSYNEVIEMSNYVDFQSHSMFHPCLPYCTKQESEFEIINSKKQLEKVFKLKINSFSFPNGDYSDREIELLKSSGYSSGISCDLWFNNQKTNIFRLKRLDCRDDASIIELESKVTGIYHFLKRVIVGKKFGYFKNKLT
ncbi:MAG: polysaccharide deacetylase family protein, partial [Flavobacteriaceae bacterium]|nr:polysaccharide deacetylase family protein [Flavobacteriaceae bacterium]